MTLILSRCPVCGITWTPKDVALWCRYVGCPNTEQREPTNEQIVRYKINEPFVAQPHR